MLDATARQAAPEYVEGLLARARVTSPAPGAESAAVRAVRGVRWRVAPALAAALLAAIAIWRSDERVVSDPPSASPADPVASMPRVEPPPGQDIAVIQTADPSITVVWFLGGADR
jgi:hypothetical protein